MPTTGAYRGVKIQDRPYQRRAVESIQQHYNNGNNRQLASWTTGAGKTWLIAKVPFLINPHKRTLVIVHTEELMKQAKKKIERWNPGLHVGVEMGMLKSHDDHQVIVGSVQTLGNANGKRLARLKPDEFGAVITDEAHHATASGYVRIFKHFGVWSKEGPHPRKDILSLGVTATPYRTDKTGLKAVYDVICDEYNMLDAIGDGYLTDIKAYRVHSMTSLDQIKVVAGDLAQDQLAAAVNNRARNELIVDKWAEIAPERKTLAFTVDIAHAQALAGCFKEQGYKFEAVWGTDPKREEKIDDLHAGKLQGLCNAMLLTEGFDCPDVSCVVLARPTSSRLVYVQQVGRGTRTAPGKENCLVLDIADNTTKHQIVTAATLAGLPNNVKIDCESIAELAQSELAQKVSKLSEKNLELLDQRKVNEVAQLEAFLREVELFDVPDEIEKNSKLNWVKVNPDRYVLMLPGNKSINSLSIDRSGAKWDVVGKVNQTNFGDSFDIIGQAIKFADTNLKRFGDTMYKSKFRDAHDRFANKPATSTMTKLIKYLCLRREISVPNSLETMTYNTAMRLLDQLNAK